jgi:predicted nucleic acid-binding protein
MTSRSFVDTNVAVYAVDFDERERAKQQIAAGLLAEDPDQLVVSTQVLQEYYVAVTRKLAKPMTEDQATASVRSLARLAVVGIDRPLVLSAVDASREAQISLRDALIIEAAREAGCARVLTEDLSDGREIRGVRVENPFLAAGQSRT